MLLKTRFYLPPLRKNGVVRESLLEKLDHTQGGDMVLVSAPAGYGKSTLTSQWLHLRPHTFAWLTLGAEHNSEEVFWRYTLNSMQNIQPDIGAEAISAWEKGELVSTQQLVVYLLNDLDRLTERNHSNDAISIVFDDFHYIDNPNILQTFNLFLDHLPSSIRVIITARDLPKLKLAKRRTNGQLHEFSSSDLRFSDQEAMEFFSNTMGVAGQEQFASQVCSQTEGWVAGLQLIALSLRKAPGEMEKILKEKDLHRHIADYLMEEVFSSQPTEVQQFLWISALPNRFCAALCNKMTGAEDGLSLIQYLEQNDLFLVPLDNHRIWYRYHDLFRQFLLQHARATSPDRLDEYINSAIQWFQEQGYYQNALLLCVEQQRWSALQKLLNDEYAYQGILQHPDSLNQWLQLIPDDVVQSSPQIQHLLQSDQKAKPSSLPLPTTAEPLTKREQKVLQLITEGLSNKAIAEQLYISQNTLKVHIRNLYGKLGVENRSQALVKMQTLK